ncbi:hypothetical protein Fmac_006143 [Flemingia macrophylla]|uniref:Uncharacterized protein n=1 Tax=Flemingia macrophylla TaxID=520843 RepID=A0ABD1NA90_9FABA
MNYPYNNSWGWHQSAFDAAKRKKYRVYTSGRISYKKRKFNGGSHRKGEECLRGSSFQEAVWFSAER